MSSKKLIDNKGSEFSPNTRGENVSVFGTDAESALNIIRESLRAEIQFHTEVFAACNDIKSQVLEADTPINMTSTAAIHRNIYDEAITYDQENGLIKLNFPCRLVEIVWTGTLNIPDNYDAAANKDYLYLRLGVKKNLDGTPSRSDQELRFGTFRGDYPFNISYTKIIDNDNGIDGTYYYVIGEHIYGNGITIRNSKVIIRGYQMLDETLLPTIKK